MTDFRLFVFGPASGSIAFQLPSCEKWNDDKLFLASSDFELNKKCLVFKIERVVNVDSDFFRVILYKQVYERGMDRMGHSFGVAIDLFDVLPSPSLIQSTLLEILVFVEKYCVTNEDFCGFENFSTFIKIEFNDVYNGIVRELFSESIHFKTKKHIDGIALKSFSRQVTTIDDISVSEFIDWFINGSSSHFITSLIIYPENSGTPGNNFPYYDAIKFYDQIIPLMHKKIINFESSLALIKSNELLKTNTIAELNEINNALNKKISLLEKDLFNSSILNLNYVDSSEAVQVFEPLITMNDQRIPQRQVDKNSKSIQNIRVQPSKKMAPEPISNKTDYFNIILILLCIVIVIVIIVIAIILYDIFV